MEKCPGCNGTNINISYEHGDYVSHYQCLDCGATWERAGINRKGAALKKSHPILVFAATIIMGFSMMACTADSEEPSRESGLSTEKEPIIYNIEDTESEAAETEATEVANLDTEATEPTEQEAAMAVVAEPEIQYGEMTVTALNVGQGLSILINADDHLMLYDGGGRDTSSYVVSYLKNRGYTDFDYMVSSHYDEDHLAGLCVLSTKIPKNQKENSLFSEEEFPSFGRTLLAV